jgi:hypothetical protein
MTQEIKYPTSTTIPVRARSTMEQPEDFFGGIEGTWCRVEIGTLFGFFLLATFSFDQIKTSL